MYTVLSMLTRLVAPILCFTAEEIWKCMPHAQSEDTRSVFLNSMPAYDEALTFCDVMEKWNKLFEMRDDVMKALEIARAEKLIGKSLDAKVTVYAEGEEKEVLSSFASELATVFITSQAVVCEGAAPENAFKDTTSGISVLVEAADGEKCDRCWMYSINTVSDGEGCVCERCKSVLGI
jgi:isoleucyl-tRNA synthetase